MTSQHNRAQEAEVATNENATNGKWTSVRAAKPGSASLAASDWKLRSRDGKDWTGSLKIQPVSGESHQYTATLTIARAS